MTEKFKFKVSIEKLSFEFEGSREQSQMAQAGLTRTLGNLFETQSKILAIEPADPKPSSRMLFEEPVEQESNGQALPPPALAEKPKRSRKSSGGPTIVELVTEMKSSGFFKEARSLKAILGHLKTKGHNIKSGSITGTLQKHTQSGMLFRTKIDANYVYWDTPFNEAPRTEDSSADAAK